MQIREFMSCLPLSHFKRNLLGRLQHHQPAPAPTTNNNGQHHMKDQVRVRVGIMFHTVKWELVVGAAAGSLELGLWSLEFEVLESCSCPASCRVRY